MSTLLPRRTVLLALPAIGLLAACSATEPGTAPTTAPTGAGPAGPGADPAAGLLAGVAMTVAKSPTCGCCTGWIDHAEAAGATVTIDHPADLGATFADAEITPEFQACHLTTTDAAIFVGHIPLRFVAEYLAAPPADARGLAVPGMPTGTPGMEAGDALDPYDVLTLNNDGSTSVYARVQTLADQEA